MYSLGVTKTTHFYFNTILDNDIIYIITNEHGGLMEVEERWNK